MTKKYQIIYADPPYWNTQHIKDKHRGAHKEFPQMKTHEIKKLPVAEISSENCCLFLWTTCCMLPDSLKIMESWGFRYITMAFVWIKPTKNRKWIFGMGNWTRQNAEFCLLGIKGKPKRVSASIHSIIESPRGKMAQKPEETKKRIIGLMGNLPRIELFARQKTEGWDAWGNEIKNDIEL